MPAAITATAVRPPIIAAAAPTFQRVTADALSKGPAACERLPRGLAGRDLQWEKRNLALEIPVWDPAICIQCNWCALVCPHAAIRTKIYEPTLLGAAPAAFPSTSWRGPELKGMAYTIQVAPEDCTGCNLCVTVCPAKDKSNPRHKAIDMMPQRPIREQERERYQFFLDLPEVDRTAIHRINAKGSQLFLPLFEYSGACAGCGGTAVSFCPALDIRADCECHRLPASAAQSSRHRRAMPTAAVRPGPIPSSRTTPNSDWACAWRPTCSRAKRSACSARWPLVWGATW
jgi:pyruvate-ferredoxin/flavodoxin oxidoreductase